MADAAFRACLGAVVMTGLCLGLAACQFSGGREDGAPRADGGASGEGGSGGQVSPPPPLDLPAAAAEVLLRGCDPLDTAHCLLPFPSDHFSVAAAEGTPQSAARGGTGRRIAFPLAAMPRNVLGKPIDPTEWNRNDGYSPGQMIVSLVPELAANEDGTIPGAPTIGNPALSLDIAASRVLVLDAETGQPHPVWAEINLNAGTLLVNPADNPLLGEQGSTLPNPKPAQAALLVRPAVNFAHGRRYIVVLKDLRDGQGERIAAGAVFAGCRDRQISPLPPLAARCQALEEGVFPLLEDLGLRDESLYLAWDFTVNSAENAVQRIRHMRDTAFIEALGQVEDEAGHIQDLGAAPNFEILEVIDLDDREIVREIRGVFEIPSFVVPFDPAPLDGDADFRALVDTLPAGIQDLIENGPLFSPIELSLPPNRLNYLPDADSANACDPSELPGALLAGCLEQARFGDGLPDRSGTLNSTFTCRIARSTLGLDEDQSVAEADPARLRPARPAIYGHGLLGSHGEISQDQLQQLANDHNILFCATDWFGFASGDLPNVVSMTLDVSLFPLIPDGTQQGVLNMAYLARLLRHPQGFAAHPAFQVEGRPLHLNGLEHEVYYDGNSQGGITGGVVVAVSKDIRRGVLGVPGMNYSTLLRRSVDFDIFSVPLYAAYPDDLDRDLVLSLIQMLWDRSENNGYAHHISDNSALRGPDNRILLHPAFGDHQVTMWSADVMARTLGATVERGLISVERREPVGFNNPELPGFEVIDYANPEHVAGSLLMYWDEAWPDSEAQDCVGMSTPTPPVGNVPPRLGDDPHECARREVAGRCQKSHFLQPDGRLIDVRDRSVDPGACPALN